MTGKKHLHVLDTNGIKWSIYLESQPKYEVLRNESASALDDYKLYETRRNCFHAALILNEFICVLATI